eukprot:11158457-Lingulodinium_polyedra.AAC.1
MRAADATDHGGSGARIQGGTRSQNHGHSIRLGPLHERRVDRWGSAARSRSCAWPRNSPDAMGAGIASI